MKETNIFYNVLLFFCFISFIIPVGAFEITTDSITETSIVWNLSQRGENTIEEITLDGIILKNYSPNATRIVQSNLKPSETHIITVTDSSLTLSELSVSTLTPTEKAEDFFGTLNLWVLVILALVFTMAAIFIRFGALAFIGSIFSVIGILTSVGNSFLTGLIFAIMLIVSLFVGFS